MCTGGGISILPHSSQVIQHSYKPSKSFSISSLARRCRFRAASMHTLLILCAFVFISLSATTRSSAQGTQSPSVNPDGTQITLTHNWTSFCSSDPVDFSSWESKGVKAYVATGLTNDNRLELVHKVIVPAGVGFLLHSDNSNVTVTVKKAEREPNKIRNNMLRGVLKDTIISQNSTSKFGPCINFILTRADENSEWGLYKVNKEGNMVRAGKAYLPVETEDVDKLTEASSPAKIAGFVLIDETTGIKSIENVTPSENDSHIYDLQGRYVGKSIEGLRTGIYIRNGKKIIKK